MLEVFLHKLESQLHPLRKSEREKYLEQYKEIYLEKIENGISEDKIAKELVNEKLIAKEILKSYSIPGRKNLTYNFKYINKIFLLGDIFALLLSYILAYFIGLHVGFVRPPILSIKLYGLVLICIIPFYIFVNFLFGLYTVEIGSRNLKMIEGVIISIAASTVLSFFVLYIFDITNFSRILLLVFSGIFLAINVLIRQLIK